jgi:hypothetical protein
MRHSERIKKKKKKRKLVHINNFIKRTDNKSVSPQDIIIKYLTLLIYSLQTKMPTTQYKNISKIEEICELSLLLECP